MIKKITIHQDKQTHVVGRAGLEAAIEFLDLIEEEVCLKVEVL